MRIRKLHCKFSCSIVAAALFAGCGASQPPIPMSALPQNHAVVGSRVSAHRAQAASSSYQVLYSFTGSPDGESPLASLIDVNGVLYGTTSRGGKHHDAGTVFSISTSGREHVLHNFNAFTTGKRPRAGLIDIGGTLYGSTEVGGQYGSGTVFSISTSGKERTLYSFEYNGDGVHPVASLTNVSSTLYGTTIDGGTYGTRSGSGYYGYGTVFSITTGGSEKVLHSFGGLMKGISDGRFPRASVIDVNGALYGTTEGGGAYYDGCCGTVFRVTTDGAEKVLHSFGASSDGSLPEAGLVNVDGTLYGTTYGGGPNGESRGTVFSISTSGKEKVLHIFGGGSDGENPEAGLIDVNGTLYGTTSGVGDGFGTVFSITPGGTEKVLYRFTGTPDGAYPYAGLIDVNGTLYGTTSAGGTCGDGTVFSLKP